MVWAPGAKILNNTYEIIDVLGMGGFGLTYRARQCFLDSEVVIKTPNPLLKNRPLFANFVKRFLDEAKQLDKLRPLNHPHIVSIRGVFEHEGTYGMVMDYVAGRNMIDTVRYDGALREAEAIRCIKDVGGALMAMHSLNLVHRDVHPGNIMLRQHDGKPILIDFGLATEVADEVASYDHFAHKIFAAYEQSQGDGRVTVDVYALAGSLFFLVTGKNPTAAAMRMLGSPLEFPQGVRLSDRTKAAIAAGMAMDVSKRTPSVAAWLALLEPPTAPVPLKSAKNIDYRELEQLLKTKQWYEADQLTGKLMLKASGREKEGWIDLESIKNFPCADLRTIDQLWVHYSNGLYGFSVQKQIYVECGGKLDFSTPSSETWEKFCNRTAWKSEGEWVNYPDKFFNNNFMSVKGHLPGAKDWWAGVLFSHRDL